MTTYIAYLRVSTQKQGQSGLGLEAQQEALRCFVRDGDIIAGTFIEVESGRNCERPQFTAAMEACRRSGAILLIATLSRLARRVSFISALMDGDVPFVAADNPHATRLTLHILAAVAEAEADATSARTKAALAAAKARGVRLGGFRGHMPVREAGLKGNAVRSAAARARALSLRPLVEEARAAGASTFSEIAAALNAKAVGAPRGGAWAPAQVRRILLAA